VISPRVIAAALLNGFAVSVNRVGVLAAPRQRNAEAVISVRVIGLLFDGSAKSVDRAIDVAEVEQRAGKLIMCAREIAVAHLNRHAVAADGFVKPSLIIKDEAFIEILLRRIDRAAHRGILLNQ